MGTAIALTLSQLDVTAMRIFVTEIGNATDNDVFELFVFWFPHCSIADDNYIKFCICRKTIFPVECTATS